MIDLSRYGEAVRSYSGNGQLEYHSFGTVACTFELAQYSNGDVRLRCVIPAESDHLYQNPQDRRLPGESFTGINQDNLIIRINGELLTTNRRFRFNDEGNRLYWEFLVIGRAQIGTLAWDGEAELRFHLTNFRFIGTEWEETSPHSGRLSLLPIKLNGAQVLFRQVPEYSEREVYIRARRGIEITCTASFHIHETSEIEPQVELIERLCNLLSLARGTLISWLFYEVVSGEDIIYIEHSNAITRPYVGYALIDPNTPNDIKHFVESTYLQYLQLDPRFQFRRVILVAIEARSGSFIQIRGLSLAMLAEYLSGVPLSPGEELPFEKRLTNVLQQFRVPVSNIDIEDFIKSRNRLVHHAAFRTESPSPNLHWAGTGASPVDELKWMIYFMDRFLLRMLGYEGFFVNATNFQREELIPLPC